MRLQLIKVLLLVPIAITGLSLCLSLVALMGTGTFHADYYYQPLHDFVDPSRRAAMEELVIELFNAQQQLKAQVSVIRDAICLASLVIALVLVTRLGERVAARN